MNSTPRAQGAASNGSGRSREHKVTIGDVAARAGVSKSAVSFAFNGRPGVAEDTKARILEAARVLGWQPDARARALSQSRAQALGLVIRREPELLGTDPFFPQFVAGVESYLCTVGYVLVLQVVGDEEAEKDAYSRFSRQSRVDGVFLTDLRVADPRPAALEELGLPAVVLGMGSEGVTSPIGPDDAAGVRRAVRHLHALGHKRIAHVSGDDRYVHSRVRREAWAEELRRLGLKPGRAVQGDFSGSSGARATHELLDDPEPPTAIVYANDLMAIAGISAAIERGIRVPHDLSVIGFDDAPLAPYVSPPLTTVRQDVFQWGRECARALVEAVEGREVGEVRLSPVDFIVRGSTAPATASASIEAPEETA